MQTVWYKCRMAMVFSRMLVLASDKRAMRHAAMSGSGSKAASSSAIEGMRYPAISSMTSLERWSSSIFTFSVVGSVDEFWRKMRIGQCDWEFSSGSR